jgi:hypothetical protein
MVRIRKPVGYGQPQSYAQKSGEWHAEYVSTSLYYMQANRATPGICPSVFLYHVSEEITCTVETYMGERLNLESLDKTTARRMGRQIGNMMRVIHGKKSHIRGTGELAWDGANLYGTVPARHPMLARKIDQSYQENILLALTEEGPSFDHGLVRSKLRAAHMLRNDNEPTVLINRDITPENLTVQRGGKVGIIDPYPYLGNGTRFAAWFIHCYRFLLPAYARTARYEKNQYQRFAPVLGEIAAGFERGYIQGDHELGTHIAAERWLWTLEQAYDDFDKLNQPNGLSEAKRYKHGEPPVIRARLKAALRALELLDF